MNSNPWHEGSGAQSNASIASSPLAALSATLDRDDPAPRPGDPRRRRRTGCISRRGRAPARSAPTATRAAGGRRRRRCRAACGPAGDQFIHPLRVGDEITRNSRIADIKVKSGRSGTLVFVTVHHAIASNARGVALTEEHDIVFRDLSRSMTPTRRRWRRPIRNLCARDRARPGAAVSLFGADLQRPSYPLRSQLRDRGRRLSGLDRARATCRHAAAGPRDASAPTHRCTASTSRRPRLCSISTASASVATRGRAALSNCGRAVTTACWRCRQPPT